MTWNAAASLIGRELHRLMEKQAEWIGAEDLLPDDETGNSARRDLHQLDLNTRDRLDEAIRHFATTSEWPPLSMEERYILTRRLFCALDLVDTLTLPTGNPLVPEPQADESQVIEWLLNTTWRSRSSRWLTAVGSCHTDPRQTAPDDEPRRSDRLHGHRDA